MANLSQMAEDVMGEAYTYVLTHYSPDNDAQLKRNTEPGNQDIVPIHHGIQRVDIPDRIKV